MNTTLSRSEFRSFMTTISLADCTATHSTLRYTTPYHTLSLRHPT